VPTNIFLSVGHALTSEQKQFVDAVGALLTSHDLVPRTVGRTDFADRQPLKHIAEVLRLCSGTIVVALKRIQITAGSELNDSSVTSDITNVSLPTVWNQIEAAMAYSMGQPLLTIVETGLRNEGVLEDGYDWYVKWLDLTPASLAEPAFLKTFAAWKNSVITYQARQSDRSS
jgi:hypothetical protein